MKRRIAPWLVCPMLLLFASLPSCKKGPQAKSEEKASYVKPGGAASETGGDVFIEGKALTFTSLAGYEKYANLETDRTILKGLADGSAEFTSIEEKLVEGQNSEYEGFLAELLNEDHIVTIANFLVKVDLENERTLAIDKNLPNAYSTLVNNDLSAAGLYIFNTEEDAIEVFEMVQRGELDPGNYRAYLDGQTARRCPGADRHDVKNIEQWDEIKIESCPASPYDIYGMDNKTVYQKAGIYFSLQSKIKSRWRCYYGNWEGTLYKASLNIKGEARFRKRCDGEQTRKRDDYHTGKELNWRPYEGSRSLSHYWFDVEFRIKHEKEANYHVSQKDYLIRSNM
jgi:hypothetical protein